VSYARRTDHLKAEGAYFVLAQAQALEAQGKDIVHLEIGQPDIDTFETVASAGIEAIQSGRTRYNPPAGLPQLRAAIAADVGGRLGLEISPDQVVVSPGAKPNLFFPTMALIEAGDEVLYPDPGFPSYAAMIGVAGGVPVPVPLVEQANFSFDLNTFDRLLSDRTRMIILNSPGNPTGGVMPLADLEHIADAAFEHDCWVISDEIYSRIHYLEGWILKNLRDDRLAVRLWCDASRACQASHPLGDPFLRLHSAFHTVCWAGGVAWITDTG
jgi:aspartate aminotransferase